MEQNDLNTIVIDKILYELLLSKEELSNQKFEQLCLYLSDADIEIIFERLLRQADTQSIYWLIKYLLKIEQPLGFEKLFALTENGNDLIRQEARLAFKNLSMSQQVDSLLRSLESRWIDNVIYSAYELGQLRSLRCVVPLMDTVVKYQYDHRVLLNAIRSLGRVRDRRAIIVLERFLNHEDPKILDAVLKSLWNFNDILQEKLLDQWLAKGNLKVKEFIYLKLVQQMSKKWQYYLSSKLSLERNEALKLSMLSSLRTIQVKPLFDTVLCYAQSDPSFRVRMLAESVLKKIRSKQLLRWILDQERSSFDQDKILIMKVLSTYSSEPIVFEIFHNLFLSSQRKRIQLMSLEYMGHCSNRRVIPFLLEIIKNNDEFAYAACLSLTYQLNSSHWSEIKEILSLDIEKRGICIQLILKFILRVHQIDNLPDTIVQDLKRLAVCTSEHIRYLGLKSILKTDNPDKLYLFLFMARFDKSFKVRQSAQEAIVFDLNRNPHKILSFLSLGVEDPKLIGTLTRVFKQISPASKHFHDIFTVLLDLLLKNLRPHQGQKSQKSRRLMVLLRHHIVKEKKLFIQVLSEQSWTQQQLLILLKIINFTDIHEQIGLSVDFMAQQYEHASKDIKIEFLIFFQRMKVKSNFIEDVLFKELALTEDEELFKKIDQTINCWLKTSMDLV
ncbi:MAG: hypothetical protein WCH62_06015 [Candidatus Omnitrophota bacterium]